MYAEKLNDNQSEVTPSTANTSAKTSNFVFSTAKMHGKAIIETADGFKIRADMLYLGQYSDFFKCAFYGAYVEQYQRHIHLPTITHEPFMRTMQLLRTVAEKRQLAVDEVADECNDLPPNAKIARKEDPTTQLSLNAALEVLDVASYLLLDIVLEEVSNIICRRVTSTTLIAVHRKVENRYPRLANRLWRIIVEDFCVLVKADQFTELSAAQMLAVLRDPKLNLDPNDEFPVVQKWLKVNAACMEAQSREAMELRMAAAAYAAAIAPPSAINNNNDAASTPTDSASTPPPALATVSAQRSQAAASGSAVVTPHLPQRVMLAGRRRIANVPLQVGGVSTPRRANPSITINNSITRQPPPFWIAAGSSTTTPVDTPAAICGIGLYNAPRIPPSILLAVGGWASGGPTNQLEFFEQNRNEWMAVQSRSTLAFPERRAYHTTVITSAAPGASDSGARLFVIGGYDGVRHHKSVNMLNLETWNWSEVGAMNEQRCYVSADTLDDRHILVAGGFNESERLRSAEIFDVRLNQWTFAADMNVIRSDSDCVNIGGRLYVVGGFDGTLCHNTCEVYDAQTQRWSMLGRVMHHKRSGVKATRVGEHVLVVVGGFTGHIRLKSPEFYDTREGIWHVMADMSIKRSNFGISTFDNRVVACGGYNNVSTTAQCEAYDFRANAWTSLPDMSFSRSALALSRIDRHEIIGRIVEEYDHRDFPPLA